MSHPTRLAGATLATALVLGAAATAQAADSVVHVIGTETYAAHPAVTTEAFSDEATGDALAIRFDAAGQPASASSIDYGAPGDRPALRWVDFAAHGVFDLVAPPAPRVPETRAAFLARLRATGGLKVTGHEVVDGRDAVVLASTHGGQISERYWVDEATGRPLQEQERGTGYVTTLRFTYLPRTAENLARLQLAVPAGFTRLDGPPQPASAAAPRAKAAKRGRAKRTVARHRAGQR